MTTAADDWETVTEARVPLADLPRLAALRDRRDVRVVLSGGVAWVRWSESRADVVRALLPLAGAEFFRSAHGIRYRFGSRLPTGEKPPAGEDKPLASVLFPSAVQPTPPTTMVGPRIAPRLVRGGPPQPATALLCRLAALGLWADTATTAELAAVTGLLSADRAVLFGTKLPVLAHAERFHGESVLLPVGFRLEPDLPAEAVRSAAGAEPGEVVLFTESGWDRIPRDRAEPLTRAGIRLALTEALRPVNHRGDYYLTLPDPATIGGLRWSAACDAIEDADGRTVVVFEELEAVLAGVFAAPPVPPFVFVLQFLLLLRLEKPYARHFAPLRESYRRHRKVESVSRHLGLLIAEACRSCPADADPPTWVEVQLAMARLRSNGTAAGGMYALVPPLTYSMFADWINHRVGTFPPSVLDHWLTFGSAPTDAGQRLVEEVEALPVSVADVVAEARTRPRLVGATVLTPTLDAALSLPPRRRTPDALPQGGYADVSNRGDPDQLLLSQFALDPDEFVRRFAERELLYFKREEPHAPTPPERVIVLDQGVRTWGPVRLALAAATLSLLQHSPTKGPLPRLFATSISDEVPVPPATAEALAQVLEASDLTGTPADALRLAGAVSDPDTPRDLVLLTHPRAAAEPDVLAAARALAATDRLFVLAVAEDGSAQLTEWSARGPVPVRAFRVDLDAADAAKPARKEGPPETVGPMANYHSWTGDVEPVPFPFRPGLIGPPGLFGFDARGEWLAILTRAGFPHALAPEDTSAEVLPRAVIGGHVLKQVTAILPVTGGVVLCGVMPTNAVKSGNAQVSDTAFTVISAATEPADTHVAVHYDRRTRTVRAFVFGPVTGVAEWAGFTDLHCAVLRSGTTLAPLALDLATEKRHPMFEVTARATEAQARTRTSFIDVKRMEVVSDLPSVPPKKPMLVRVNDTIRPMNPDQTQEWPPHRPTEDGKPLLDGATIHSAQLAADVLAFEVRKGSRHELRLYRGPDPVSLGVVPLDEKAREFVLSPHGRMIAWARRQLDVALASTTNPANVLASVAHAGLHGRFEVRCAAAPFLLTIHVGSFQHQFTVAGGVLAHQLKRDAGFAKPGKPVKLDRSIPAGWDATRFTAVAGSEDGRFRVLGDKFGQVLLLNRTHALLAAFLIRRDKAAAWTPAGGFWGDAALIGGAPAPHAGGAIGRAIQTEGEVP